MHDHMNVSLVTKRSTFPLDATPVGFIFHDLAGRHATRMAVHLSILNYIRMNSNFLKPYKMSLCYWRKLGLVRIKDCIRLPHFSSCVNTASASQITVCDTLRPNTANQRSVLGRNSITLTSNRYRKLLSSRTRVA
jgi:hypothetical protein